MVGLAAAIDSIDHVVVTASARARGATVDLAPGTDPPGLM